MPEWGTVASIILALAAFVTAVFSRIKLNADADVSIAKQAMDMVKEVRLDVERLKAEAAVKDKQIESLQKALDDMEARMVAKDKQIEQLLAGVGVLCIQVKALGQEPMFRPSQKGEGAM
jgi:septal ring factor EnvC (AmiA/AmiB activator)